MMIFRLVSNRTLESFHGCISTGKEANVYHAFSTHDWDAKSSQERAMCVKCDRTEVAVKVFKTAILVFKDRDKYVTGEHRYRNGYCKKNPRKMVKVCQDLKWTNPLTLLFCFRVQRSLRVCAQLHVMS